MNRMEYEHSVTDLFGTEFSSEGTFSSDASTARIRLRDKLPPDDTAFGFDNIGDFQTLSPALLEKYFDIAEFVVDQVIVTDGPKVPVQNIGRGLAIDRLAENRRTEHHVNFEVEHAGRYRVDIQFSLGGWREFGGGFDFVALENFDIIGRWRDIENGEPIQPDEVTVTGQKLAGIDDLRNYFASRKDRFYRGTTEKLLTYALGRGLDPMDAPAVDSIAARLLADDGKFSTLLMAVIESPQFQSRRGDDGLSPEAPRVVLPTPPPPDQRKGRRTMRALLDRRARTQPNPLDFASPAEPAPPANP